MHFDFLIHYLEPCYRYYICLGHRRVRDISTESIPRDRWSKASIICESSSLLLLSDHEKPSELGTDTFIQQLFVYQQLKPYIKSERQIFHGGSVEVGNQSPFSAMAAVLKVLLKVSVQTARGFGVHCFPRAWTDLFPRPAFFFLCAAPSTKKVLSKQCSRIIQMLSSITIKSNKYSHIPLPLPMGVLAINFGGLNSKVQLWNCILCICSF